MSDGAGSEVEVSSEGGSDAERFEEAASQVEEGAAEQAERGTAVPAIPAWAAELLEQLAKGEMFSARDQTRLQLALDLRRERVAAVQQEKAELASRAQQGRAIALKEKENAALLAVIAKQDRTLEALSARVFA